MKKCFSRRRVWIGDTSVRHGDRGVLVRNSFWGLVFGVGVGARVLLGSCAPCHCNQFKNLDINGALHV
jgi:hypothetical protein